MWPSNFEYHRATSVAEAIEMLAGNDDAKALAGGHSLLAAMKLRLSEPGTLIDLGGLDELKTISAENGTLSIGALATHAQIAASADVQSHAPALATACGLVGDQQVRNWGTLGGNLAHADPASDPPTVVLAYGGTIHVQGPDGSRAIGADDFFTGLFMTDLQPGEIITSVTIPSASGKNSAYAKLAHPASRYAMVGVCVVLEMDGDNCTGARVAVGGAIAKATRSSAAEAALVGPTGENTLNAAAEALKADLGDEVMGDIHASEDYRRAMAGVYFKRAVMAAM